MSNLIHTHGFIYTSDIYRPAKSTGMQEEQDLSIQDASLFRVLSLKKKISKSEANYTERRRQGETKSSVIAQTTFNPSSKSFV